jgi:ABC-type multidrug transport system ATPase subunit
MLAFVVSLILMVIVVTVSRSLSSRYVNYQLQNKTFTSGGFLSSSRIGNDDTLHERLTDESDDTEINLSGGRFKMDLSFNDLGLQLPNGRYVLKNVTGELNSGKLTAVMGLSGCGKSTFITTLADKAYYGKTVGEIKINGEVDSLSKYTKLVGFVPQDDIMFRNMTVEETIQFAAASCWNKSTIEIIDIVDKTIRALGLHEIRHSIIGDEKVRGISGGQRKRVNIGMELVKDPSVLFLDEPTSGLDAASSMECCKIMRNIAESGVTVVTVIHQPRPEVSLYSVL